MLDKSAKSLLSNSIERIISSKTFNSQESSHSSQDEQAPQTPQDAQAPQAPNFSLLEEQKDTSLDNLIDKISSEENKNNKSDSKEDTLNIDSYKAFKENIEEKKSNYIFYLIYF